MIIVSSGGDDDDGRGGGVLGKLRCNKKNIQTIYRATVLVIYYVFFFLEHDVKCHTNTVIYGSNLWVNYLLEAVSIPSVSK